jgi:hypothetical protein
LTRRFNLALATALALAASRVAIAADGLSAVGEHTLCVETNAANMDDAHKTAEELAKAILPLCHAQYEAAMLASMPGRWPKMPPNTARDVELAHTITAIQRYREGGVR